MCCATQIEIFSKQKELASSFLTRDPNVVLFLITVTRWMIRYVIFWRKWLANWWSRIFVHIIIYYFKIETKPFKTSEKLVRRKGKNYKPSILRARFCVFPCSEEYENDWIYNHMSMCLPFSLLRVSKLRIAYFRNHCKIFGRKNFAKVIRRLLHLIYFKRFQELFFSRNKLC